AKTVLPEPMPPVAIPHAFTSSVRGTATGSPHIVSPRHTLGPGSSRRVWSSSRTFRREARTGSWASDARYADVCRATRLSDNFSASQASLLIRPPGSAAAKARAPHPGGFLGAADGPGELRGSGKPEGSRKRDQGMPGEDRRP